MSVFLRENPIFMFVQVVVIPRGIVEHIILVTVRLSKLIACPNQTLVLNPTIFNSTK